MTNSERAQLISDLAALDIHPLLVAVAQLTDDEGLLDERFRPETPVVAATTTPNGGLDADRVAEARELIADALLGSSSPRAEHIDVGSLVNFLTGQNDPAFTQRLKREIEVDEVAVAPVERDRPLRVAVIGAGMSGIGAAYRLKQDGHDVVIFERRSDFGGTWFVNRYPGCRLDTSNFIYSYSFAQKSDWSSKYSERAEILDYFREVAHKNGLDSTARFNSDVVSARWQAEQQTWTVEYRNRQDGTQHVEEFDAVVSAVGQLSKPLIPQVAGAERFEGVQTHSAEWPDDLDVTGKKVAVIGSGASGFQIVPAIVDSAESVVLFQRTPPWMVPTPDYHDTLPESTSRLFARIPTLAVWHRFWMFWVAVEGRYPLTIVDPEWQGEGTVSESNARFREQLVDHLRARYADRPDLLDYTVPSYAPGAKRLLRDNGAWPAALQHSKVTVDRGPVDSLTETTIRSASGAEYDVDVVVYATGFRASEILEDVEVVGARGRTLTETWNGEPRAYLGLTVPDFPNFFLLYGPNTNLVVNGSLIFMIECALDYVIDCLDEVSTTGRALDTNPEALARFVDWMEEGNAKSAWGTSTVSSWYKNANGVVTQNWPHPMTDYWRVTRERDSDAHFSVPPVVSAVQGG